MCDNAGVPQQFQAGGPVNAEDENIYETIAGRQFLVGTPGEYRPGLGDTAMALARAQFDLPEQQVAGFTGDQQRAFDIARQGVGSYKPYLDRATGLTEEGVRSLQTSLDETRALARQIPGEVRPGQEALRRAARGVEAA
jgi:hypothetical protein